MNCLFILQQSPYGGTLAREALDMALAFAAFDQTVQLLFIGDGVYQLRAGQNSDNMGIKNINKTLDALGIYDVNDVYACSASMASRGLVLDDLSLPVKAIDAPKIAELIATADKVVNL